MKPQALQSAHIEGEFSAFVPFTMGRGEEADHCSRDGALELKRKIEAYWRERGQDVMVVLHNVGFHPAIRAARFDVRSNMVNGLPRPQAAASPVAKQEAAEVFVEDFDQQDDDLSFE